MLTWTVIPKLSRGTLVLETLIWLSEETGRVRGGRRPEMLMSFKTYMQVHCPLFFCVCFKKIISLTENVNKPVSLKKMLAGNERRRYREVGGSLDSEVRICEFESSPLVHV